MVAKVMIPVHMYCFTCKSDQKTQVEIGKEYKCPACGSTNVAHEKGAR